MENVIPTYEALLDQAAKLVVGAIRKELMYQGHTGTGKLIDSIEYTVKNVFQQISIQIFAADYGKYVNYGVKSDKIPYTIHTKGDARRGGTSKYIEALEKYVLENGFVSSLKDGKSMAFAIAVKQKREGNPTSGSYKYSVTGKRTEFITDAVASIEDQLDLIIQEIMGRELQLIFEESLEIKAA